VAECEGDHAPDAFLVSCGLAATLAFCPAVRPLAAPVAAPVRANPAAPPPDPAAGMAAADAALRAVLESHRSAYARSWADSVGRLSAQVLDATPPALQGVDPALSDERLRLRPLTPRYNPPTTPAYVYPTNTAPPAWFRPQETSDLWLPPAWTRITRWEALHWGFIEECWSRGERAKRGCIPTVVLTPANMVVPARRTIWDIRGRPPVPMDFEQPIRSHLDTAFLSRALREYPDQELRSFMVQGVATKTDAGSFVTVLGPHLTSLPEGFVKVAENVDENVAKGWYGRFTGAMPVAPGYSAGQGSTAKAGAPDAKRRTSEYGAPRKATVPPAVSLNDLTRRAAWPQEVKPTLAAHASDVAVLKYAANVWGDELYCLSDDFKYYFTQFRLHPSEWHKSCFQWLSVAAAGEPVPAWVMEYVLGFGHAASSGIAQRFSHAILWLLRRRANVVEERLLQAETDPVRRA